MNRGAGRNIMFGKNNKFFKLKGKKTYDPKTERPALRCSIYRRFIRYTQINKKGNLNEKDIKNTCNSRNIVIEYTANAQVPCVQVRPELQINISAVQCEAENEQVRLNELSV